MSIAGWIAAIIGAVLATALIDVVIAEGETKKFIKGIASLLVIAVIIAPLPALFDGNFRLIPDEEESLQNPEINQTYLERVYMERYKAYELAIQRRLNAAGIYEAVIRIEIAYEGGEIVVRNVNADLTAAVYSDSAANIDSSSEVVSAVVAVLGEDARSKISIKR
jgi:hypothetical protein